MGGRVAVLGRCRLGEPQPVCPAVYLCGGLRVPHDADAGAPRRSTVVCCWLVTSQMRRVQSSPVDASSCPSPLYPSAVTLGREGGVRGGRKGCDAQAAKLGTRRAATGCVPRSVALEDVQGVLRGLLLVVLVCGCG